MKYARRKSLQELDYIPSSFCSDLHLKGITTHQERQFNYVNTEVLKGSTKTDLTLYGIAALC